MPKQQDLTHATAAAVRDAVRRGEVTGPTAGFASGYVQANVVILPAGYADEFAEFCRLNDQACPSIARTAPGDAEPRDVAAGADLRTDVPRYRVFDNGKARTEEPTEVVDLWRDDFVGFLLGCSFTFERALQEAGLPVRHIDEGRNVPMYRTSRTCRTAGRFAGPLVVSMRPYTAEQVDRARRITERYPAMHGGPVHVGDPGEIGIEDITRPDFGDAVTINEGEMPIFWACGVTPQLAITAARPVIAITHAPGCMFITDLLDESFES